MKLNKFVKVLPLVGVCATAFLTSCADDEGNYDYTEKQVITIEGIPESIAVLAGTDYLDFKPTVTSTVDGAISADNKDYSFVYQRKNSEGHWVDVENGKDIYQLATLGSGKHAFLFTVTDNKTGIKAMKLFNVVSTTPTSEGWMVLCNVGAEENARMDMLSQVDLDRIFASHDVIRFQEGMPQLHRAKRIGFSSNQTKNNNRIVLLAEDGSYALPTNDPKSYTEFIEVTPLNDFKQYMFLGDVDGEIVNYACAAANIHKPDHDAVLAVSDKGNAYAWNTSVTMSAFELPINTSKRGEAPEYKVAPYIGVTLKRDIQDATYGAALFFDTDNHRFIGWHGIDEATKQTCFPLPEPSSHEKKFNFNTGNMELISMVNTAFSGGVVYCFMQDGAKRHIYAINLTDDKFKQEGAYTNLNLPNFDKASLFAASSQYSVIYYAYKNIVYAYNYLTAECNEVVTLDSNEEITLIKFDRCDHPWGISGLLDDNEVKTPIYLARENQLIVGSFNAAKGDNGGILRFYEDKNSGMTLNLFKDEIEDGKTRTWEFDGYGKIVDVEYKEIR